MSCRIIAHTRAARLLISLNTRRRRVVHDPLEGPEVTDTADDGMYQSRWRLAPLFHVHLIRITIENQKHEVFQMYELRVSVRIQV